MKTPGSFAVIDDSPLGMEILTRDGRRAVPTGASPLAAAESLGVDQLWIWCNSPEAARERYQQLSTYGSGRFNVTARPGDWWQRAYRIGGNDRHLVFPQLNDAAGTWESWIYAQGPAQLFNALAAFEDAAGFLPERSPGSTAHRLLHRLHARGGNLPGIESRLEQWVQSGTGPLIWMRQPSPDELRRRYLHAYDKHAMYLAACSSLQLGAGVPVWHDADAARQAFALHARYRAPGYWFALVGANERDEAQGLPPAVDVSRRPQWYPTPALTLAAEHGTGMDLRAAWLWPDVCRPLEPWYKKLRDARAQLVDKRLCWDSRAQTIARDSVKAIYTHGIGWFAAQARGWDRSADNLYRPDWFDAVMTAARANIVRNAHTAQAATGQTPIAAQVDCLYYLSDEPDPHAANPGLKLGDGVGQYGVKDSLPVWPDLSEYIERADLGGLTAYLNRRRDGGTE